ncbi:MAG: hypothetical protein JST30_15515 [Armatimonadetes bacterium]|nr:hypothetical protein [Armatimonadota bacterium]
MQIAAVALALALPFGTPPEVTEHENDLFKKNIGLYLTRNSWNDDLAYLHGHFYMVPLHAAFLLDQKDWQSQFDAHYSRLVNVPRTDLCKNPLSRMQYLYTATRFLALSAKSGRKSEVNERLFRYTADEIADRWESQDAIGFDIAHFHGVRERVVHKLALFNPAKSYYAAITDEEAFVFAEAADLVTYSKATKTPLPHESTIKDVLSTARRVFEDRGTFTRDGGWLFDVGMWTDHPDLVFAGNPQITPGMIPMKVNDITMDTSHFHRFALFVVSLRNAYPPDSDDYKFYDKIRSGLAKQMNKVVLRKPDSGFPGYRLTNFMNGMNGVYRYGSASDVGPDKGYGPYELSGTFLIGWWSFLGDADIAKAYGEISKSFPLPESVMKVYQGPVYKPAPRKDKSWYENGLAELFASLGSKLPPF